ncbi:MAG: DUF2304 domain-containing protein [Acidimicrobiia bacterium]|nr:DUF2304 domain-containing protein [Acidimicrobiia bacterium]
MLVAVAGVGALGAIVVLLRRRQLRSKYALLWIVLGVALGVLGLFPGLLTAASELVGVFYPPALFLLVASAILFGVAVHFSWELSRLEERTRILAEEVALLRAERPLSEDAPPGAGPGDADHHDA